MSPDLLSKVRVELVVHMERYSMAGDDTQAERVADIITALPPDPGGEMPEPWPGMLFEDEDGVRRAILTAAPTSGGRFAVWVDGFDDPFMWSTGRERRSAAVREIRTPDGRVLWRAVDRSAT